MSMRRNMLMKIHIHPEMPIPIPMKMDTPTPMNMNIMHEKVNMDMRPGMGTHTRMETRMGMSMHTDTGMLMEYRPRASMPEWPLRSR